MLNTLHIVLLIGFIGVTALLMLVTIANRLRVEGVLLAWRTGRLFGWPLWPSLFMGAVVLLMGYGLLFDTDVPIGVFVGYLLGGSFWFAAALLSTSIFVTEHGFIRNVSRAHEALTWAQVSDYFEVEQDEDRYYVFLVIDENNQRRRLELKVPLAQQVRFRQIVRAKLDARIEFGMQQTYGKKALEG